MSYRLKLNYMPGETLVYNTVITTVAKSIEGERTERQMELRVATQVMTGGDLLRCRSQTQIMKVEGADPPLEKPFPPGPWLVFMQDTTGRIMSNSNPREPIRPVVALPKVRIEVDDAWEVSEPTSPDPESKPAVMEFHLEEVENRDGEEVAIIGCGGEMELDEGSCQAVVEGTIHFSITRGRKLWSKIVFSASWDSGRKLDSTEEATLLEPEAAAR